MPAKNELRELLSARLRGGQKAPPSAPDGGPRADTRIADHYARGLAGGSSVPPPAPIDEYADDTDTMEPPEEPTEPQSPCIAAYLALPKATRQAILAGDEAAIAEWQDAAGEED